MKIFSYFFYRLLLRLFSLHILYSVFYVSVRLRDGLIYNFFSSISCSPVGESAIWRDVSWAIIIIILSVLLCGSVAKSNIFLPVHSHDSNDAEFPLKYNLAVPCLTPLSGTFPHHVPIPHHE
jgi:hypothetical protein